MERCTENGNEEVRAISGRPKDKGLVADTPSKYGQLLTGVISNLLSHGACISTMTHLVADYVSWKKSYDLEQFEGFYAVKHGRIKAWLRAKPIIVVCSLCTGARDLPHFEKKRYETASQKVCTKMTQSFSAIFCQYAKRSQRQGEENGICLHSAKEIRDNVSKNVVVHIFQQKNWKYFDSF